MGTIAIATQERKLIIPSINSLNVGSSKGGPNVIAPVKMGNRKEKRIKKKKIFLRAKFIRLDYSIITYLKNFSNFSKG